MGKDKATHIADTRVGEPAFLPEFVSYAQNFEDVMLRRALRDVENGFYVDIGAFHPFHHSVSCWFYQNGWQGINVEPNQKFFVLLAAERHRDVNLQVAITGKSGPATLYLYDALSTVQEEIAAAHRKRGIDLSQTVRVEAMTLDQLFEGYVQSRTVDFLKLDVEGSECEILTSTSFERTRPRILVVEATKPDSREPTWSSWEKRLRSNGYLFVWFDGLNRFYLREEDHWRRKFFKTPPNVFDSFRFSPNDSRIKFGEGKSVEALSHQISTLDIEREQLAAMRSSLERELEFAKTDVSRRIAECDRLVSVTGHLERALSAALDKIWNFSSETNTLIRQKVEAEAELQAARSQNSQLVAERDAIAADKIRIEGELQAARSQNSRVVAERDKLTVEIARHQVKLRARESELEAAQSEIARHQRADADLVHEHERLALDSARWFEAAVAAAYARRSQPEGPRRHLKVMITASGWRLKCSISRSEWERGPRMSLALAARLLSERQWQLAARCYGDVLEQWPNNAAVWVQFGHALKESGRITEAEAVYRHAIQLSPVVADTHLQLGHALKLQGRISEAIEAYAAALRLDPTLGSAADELMALGWSSSDVEKAKSSDRSTNNRPQLTSSWAKFAKLAL